MPVPVQLLPDGAKPRGSDFNKLRAQLEAQRITGAAGLLASGFSGGSTLAALGFPPFIRRTGTPSPFRIYNASSGATLKLGVTSGTVNGGVPTLGGTALDNATPPTLTITASTWLWLKCVGTFGTPDTYVVTVENSATSAVPSGTAISGTGFTSYLSIGFAVVASGAITVISPANNANWAVESYGSVNLWWK